MQAKCFAKTLSTTQHIVSAGCCFLLFVTIARLQPKDVAGSPPITSLVAFSSQILSTSLDTNPDGISIWQWSYPPFTLRLNIMSDTRMRAQLTPAAHKKLTGQVKVMSDSWGADFSHRIPQQMQPESSARGTDGTNDPMGWSMGMTRWLQQVASKTAHSLDDAMWLLRVVMQHRHTVGDRKLPISAIDWVDARVAAHMLEEHSVAYFRQVLKSDKNAATQILEAAIQRVRDWRVGSNTVRREKAQVRLPNSCLLRHELMFFERLRRP